MLLAIDVGNTNMVFGIFEGEALVGHWRIKTWRRSTAQAVAEAKRRPGDAGWTVEELGAAVAEFVNGAGVAGKVQAAVVSSVVPPLTGVVVEMCRHWFGVEPLVVTHRLDLGIRIRYPRPEEIGADRLVNAVAAFSRYGGPLIIVDFGTAITFCLVTEAGEYLGGCIVPGLEIGANALHEYTAKLPRVEVVRPEVVVGRSTVESIQAGLFYGCVALVEGLVERLCREFGAEGREKVKVVACGGLAEKLARDCRRIEYIEPLLTLEGLRLIYQRNRLRREAVGGGGDTYLAQVEQYFLRKRRRGVCLSPRDWEQVMRWQQAGIPLRVVLQGIERALERAGRRREVYFLSYCDAAVQEVWREYRRALVGGGGETRQEQKGRFWAELEVWREEVVRALAGHPQAEVQELAEWARSWLLGLTDAAGAVRFFSELAGRLGGLLDAETKEALAAEVEGLIGSYARRMSQEALADTRRCLWEELVLERFGIPVLDRV